MSCRRADQNPTKQNESRRKNRSSNEKILQASKRCDTTHNPREWPAYQKTCKKCEKKNHFTKCCRSKKVEAVTGRESDSDDSSDVYVSALSNKDKDNDEKDWFETGQLLPEGIKIKLKNNKIRLCIDPFEINKNLKRRHYPINTIEEIATRITGSQRFSLLDCKKGF